MTMDTSVIDHTVEPARQLQERQSHAPVGVAQRTVSVDGLDIFYREAGSPRAPTILLLHGFPTSSRMFRELMPLLAEDFHLVAPDYPGFGKSEAPPMESFDYSFESLADVIDAFTSEIGLERYSLYVMDYGAPVGFRLATRHPDRVEALIVQNGNAYEEGLGEFWDPLRAYWDNPSNENAESLRNFLSVDAIKWQYTHGTRNPDAIIPGNWLADHHFISRRGNDAIQLQLFYDYRSNPPLYREWQTYLRAYQPPTLVVWGKNDEIFLADGARAYARDLETVEIHLLDTGHFALEEDGAVIAEHMRRFLGNHL